ncbi:MAG: xanthine dehydrogenase family protein subunit M [Aestuariivirga sp.]|uniref:FAD binding domain-containing protein n=1 Tax=Aestuariivirga sp. TaxID=2650926 RepID=UPI0025C172D6|nr:xanthine dehydrogenase family protein subunit M [Aestuariivirga sp.]MCA3560601.1 xanthine dehydrogenase family protein subunit M [Aestuariivirga sp.]
MENFNYYRPASVDDAVKAAKAKPDAKYMSGGMTLIPTMKQGLASPSDIIDLGALKNSGIAVGATVVIKAGTTHAEVASSADVKKAIPALAALAGGIGDPHVRHKGTIGGSVANNDPAADYPSACLGLGATIHTNARKIKAEDFFTGMFSTALEDGEVITAIEFPIPKKAGYAKFPNPASRYAMVGVFAADTAEGPRVAVTGAGAGVFRASALESALGKGFAAGSLTGAAVPAKGLNSDLHASAEYRAHLITVMAKRAVDAAK